MIDSHGREVVDPVWSLLDFVLDRTLAWSWEDDYRGDWTIDVSSPGPERPLRRSRHFAEQTGRRVQIRTSTEVGGKTRFRGEVLGADDTAVVVAVDGRQLTIPVETIVRGNLIDEDGQT